MNPRFFLHVAPHLLQASPVSDVVGALVACASPIRDAVDFHRCAGSGDLARPCFGFFLHNGAQAALNDWLAVRGAQAGAVFNPINKGGRIEDAGLTTTAMHKILAKRATEAGVENVTLHDFRRTVTGDLLDKGADIASVNTTARYDRRGQRARIAASQLVSVPYVAA